MIASFGSYVFKKQLDISSWMDQAETCCTDGQRLVLIQSLQSILIAFCIEIESNYQPLIVKEILLGSRT